MKRFAIWLMVYSLLLVAFAPAALAAPAKGAEPVRSGRGAPAAAGEFIVKFKPGTTQAQKTQAARKDGGSLVRRIGALGLDVLSVPALKSRPNPQAAERVLNGLKQNPNVLYAEPNYIYRTTLTPNDPRLSSQWAWNKIQAPAAWDVTQGSSSTVIAVVDTGVQRNHPDLDGKIVAGYDFVQNDAAPDDGNGHGTHVAGTAAAETGNATGGAGTCPGCSIMPVRVLDNNGSGTLEAVANGIIWAADNGAHVINMSLGGPSGSPTLQNAVDYAWNQGVFLACAAGNSNTSAASYPAYYSNCFAVASTTSSDARSSFSNYGNWVEVAAPGSSIYSTYLGSSYRTLDGTSMATPHVAGLAGLLASQGLTNAQIRDQIMATADKIAGTGTYWTGGRINANAAVSGGTPPPPPPPPPPPSALQNGGFENGTAPWVETSTGGFSLVDPYRPHSGIFSAWLGGYNSGTDTISQTVTVPANGTLSYWWYLVSNEGTGVGYDFLRVRLYDTSGRLVATVKSRSNRDVRNSWQQDTVSLAAYAGQTLRLEFAVTLDYSLTSSFWIDDVSLQ
ncbi:MAG: alkaline proteinase [Symbiobacteriaceae bacterium]|jgi:subtilisin family serine protease|nr:alkaline proteinase [Symbiobacteriaceae bacterium]